MSYNKTTWEELFRAERYLELLHMKQDGFLDKLDDVREKIKKQEHEVECWADKLSKEVPLEFPVEAIGGGE